MGLRSRSWLDLHKATLLAAIHAATVWVSLLISNDAFFYWTQKGPSKGDAGRLFCASLDIPADEKPDDRSDQSLLLHHLPEPIDLDLDLKANVM